MKKIFLFLFSQTLIFSKNYKIGLIFFVSILFSTGAFASHAAGMDINYKFIGTPAGITGNQITITVGGGSWQNEVSWDIYDQSSGIILSSGGAPYSGTVCIPTASLGNLQFRMYDSYGDGWNGNTYSLSGNSTLSGATTGTLNNGYGPGINTFSITGGTTCTTAEVLKYEITLNFYYDCENANPNAPSSINLRWEEWANNNNGGYNTTNLSLTGSPSNITPVCSSITDPCSYGLAYAYEKYTYIGIITFPNRDSWKIWNNPIGTRNTTSYGPGNNTDDLCVVANIDNTIHLSSSPVFSSDPISFLCAGGDCFYNGATDPDLDDLSYSLTQPKTDEGLNDNMSYQNGTFLLPFPTGTTTCDPITGDLCINTTSIGTSVAAIKVSESRNGTNIGFVTRDIQIWSRACSGAANPLITATSGPITTLNSANNSFSFCVDGSSQLSFDIQAISTVNIEMINSILPNGATFTTNPSTPLTSNTVTGTFNWIPTAADIAGSPYAINIMINDDECPLPNSNSETYLIYLNEVDISDTCTPLTSCISPNGTATITPNVLSISGYSYTWNSTPIQTTATATGLIAGSYICTVTDNTTGCITDSPPVIITSTVSLPTTTASATNNTVCEGYPTTLAGNGTLGVTYSWNNNVTNGMPIYPTVTTTYTVTGIDISGCSSSDMITITVIPSTTSNDTQAHCDSYTWLDGVTYTTSNNTATFTSLNATTGCDNIATLDLTINNSTTSTDIQAHCDTYTWLDGVTYSVSNNTATYTSTNAAGCDNVAILNLTINNSTSSVDNAGTHCDSYTWLDGVTYTSSNNTATYTSTNAAGCDNVATLNLTINNSTSSVDNVGTHCDTYTWLDGVTYTSSNNTATYTSTNAAGCDNVATLNLTINNSTSSVDNVGTHCDTYTWIDGVTYTVSNNTATLTTTNAAGCNDVVTLNLTINNSTTSVDNAGTHCYTYTWIDGVTYTTSNNTATYTSTNTAGCDNVATLNLTISNSTTSTDIQVACDTYTWLDGNTYSVSNNTATWTTTNSLGCDNVATLNLTINNSTTSIDNVGTHCDSYTWTDGVTYTTSNNTATFTSTNAVGCTNLATLNLTINNSTTSTDNVGMHCDSYTWLDGITYTSSNNTANYTSINVAGCNNVATLNLIINNSTSSSFSISECYSYYWDGINYNMSGTYIRTLNTVNGCDSIVTLNLIIISGAFEITTNINITDIDCFGMNNGAINLYPSGGISPLTFNWDNGAITQNINSLPPGDYSFTITDSIGCTLDSTVSVSEPDKLIVNFQANNEICRNDSISFLIELINPIYNYYRVEFNDSIQKSFIIDSSGVLIPEGIPFYIIPKFSNQIQIISVTDNNGCSSDINQLLDIIVNQIPNLGINQDDVCEGTPSFTLNKGTPTGGDYFIDDEFTNFFDVENLENGAYTIRYEYTDIINNCSNSIEKIININPNPIAEFSFSPQPADIDNPTIFFVGESENIENTKWNLGDGTTLTDELEFWHTYTDTGTYDVIYVVRNQFNCSDTAKATLIINPVYQIFIPSAFTPDNDGHNDVFKLEIIGQKEYIMTIFNRWGELIFKEKNGIWDGKLNNKTVQNGTYSYTILVSDFKDKPFIYTGNVTLIK
jgi:gliding motility-associated-like protein